VGRPPPAGAEARDPSAIGCAAMTRASRFASADEMGIQVGAPAPPDKLVTLANWQDPPFNRWGFQHVRDLIPTARISRGSGRPRVLSPSPRSLSKVKVPVGRRTLGFDEWLAESFADGLVVLHGGRLVHESYLNGQRPEGTHLLMSVSKSITSTVAGILVGRGQLNPADLVVAHLPELAGSSFEGCTVQHLLDMRAGTRFDENYEDPRADVRVYEQIYLWRPRTSRRLPDDINAYYATLRNDGPHGGPFRYRSVLTDVLGWVLERAAGGIRLPELISREIWAPMGAEFDAEVTVDGHGNPMADGGVCATVRDLARFGQLFLDGGRRGSRRIVPAAWIRDILLGGPDTAEAMRTSPDEHELGPRGHYRDKWWVYDGAAGIYAGQGINGQTVLVHAPSKVVIAKVSTWPEAWTVKLSTVQMAGLFAICRAVGA
jgi:CubicO group peptidase (beta-lactamase class C family)